MHFHFAPFSDYDQTDANKFQSQIHEHFAELLMERAKEREKKMNVDSTKLWIVTNFHSLDSFDFFAVVKVFFSSSSIQN